MDVYPPACVKMTSHRTLNQPMSDGRVQGQDATVTSGDREVPSGAAKGAPGAEEPSRGVECIGSGLLGLRKKKEKRGRRGRKKMPAYPNDEGSTTTCKYEVVEDKVSIENHAVSGTVAMGASS